MKKMMFLSKNWYFSVQKALIYYTVNKSHHNSFILLVFSHVANFRYVANFRFLTLHGTDESSLCYPSALAFMVISFDSHYQKLNINQNNIYSQFYIHRVSRFPVANVL